MSRMPLSWCAYALFGVAVLAHSILAFYPSGLGVHGKAQLSFARQTSFKGVNTWLGKLPNQRLRSSSCRDAPTWQMLDSRPHQTIAEGILGRSTSTSWESSTVSARDTEHHRDVHVLKSQVLDEPIPSGNEPIDSAWIMNKLKVEGWTWAVTLCVALMLSLVASSPVPGQAMAALEALFFTFTLNQAREMNRPSVPEPIARDLREMWELCIGTVEEGPEAFLRGWFYDAPLESITLNDLEDFLAWAQFSTTFEQLSSQNQEAVGDIIGIFEAKLSRRFSRRAPGVEAVPSMRFTIEPMEYVHKPSLFYLSTRFALGGVTQANLRLKGFTRHSNGEFTYWMRVPKSEAARRKVPLVFFHGIGVGLIMYLGFIEKLLENHDGPIMLVELPFVSSHVHSLEAHVPSIDQQLASMEAILDEWNMDKALFMGHSYGSVMLSWMIHHLPKRVAGVAFIDPVVMLLNRKDILYNFLYKREGEGKISDIVGSELYVNFSLRRHFWWYRNILWAQDIQKANVPSLVCLSEFDEIVPSSAVRQHIDDHAEVVGADKTVVSSYTLEDASHGAILFDGDMADLLAKRLGRFVGEVDRQAIRSPHPIRVPSDEDLRVDWLVTKGRWRMRQVARLLAQIPATKEAGATAGAALMFMCLGGWQLGFLL